MAFKVDVRPGEPPVRWTLTDDGARPTPDPDYRPALYAAARDDHTRYLDWLEPRLARDPKVVDLARERHYRTLAADERSPVLRVTVERIADVRQVAREIRGRERDDHAPGAIALYDVDLEPQFRYCLDTGHDPAPDREVRTLSLSLPDRALLDGDLSDLRVEDDPVTDPASAVRRALAREDPDVLVLSTGDLVPLLADAGVDLGRRPGYRQLAGESTYASYGRVGHSPARYDVPGRVLVDRSNSFLLARSGMAGLRYFVERAGRPLQEVARDSIGGVLTAIEIREARERDVLAPWQKRQTERWKAFDTLHAADRGGFSFQPDVGVHEAVHELDFASLYPNVIREYDVSPETVCCDCHDNQEVPELGYSVCPDPGPDPDRGPFLGAVLDPLLEDRSGWKQGLRTEDLDDDAREDLEAKAEAVKWVLVSCFGYQGYRHAKFGRIETHEAINAYARDIMLAAKERIEDAGWRVVHGIVDSLWVKPAEGRDQRPIGTVAAEISDAVDIDLEHEGRFDWVAFCPRKRASGGAVMRYFGKWADGGYKLRGVEARQRSTCRFVANVQRDLLDAFDRERTPEAVADRLARPLAALRAGDVDPHRLAVTQRVSKRADEYRQATRARAALRRANEVGFDRHPGQDVEYVVVDDDARGSERVRLALEAPGTYDPGFYADRLVRAAESLVAPLGWTRRDVRRHLRDTRDATLGAYRE